VNGCQASRLFSTETSTLKGINAEREAWEEISRVCLSSSSSFSFFSSVLFVKRTKIEDEDEDEDEEEEEPEKLQARTIPSTLFATGHFDTSLTVSNLA